MGVECDKLQRPDAAGGARTAARRAAGSRRDPRGQRGFVAPELRPQMSGAQQRAQDESVRRLKAIMAAAERYCAEHPERIEPGARERVCPCGVVLRQCLCEIQRSRR